MLVPPCQLTLGLVLLLVTAPLLVNGKTMQERIFENYDKYTMPGDHRFPLVVNFSLSIIHFDLEHAIGNLKTLVWEEISWRDDRLTWEWKDGMRDEKIIVPSDHIWKPDILLFNSVTSNQELAPINVHISNDGWIVWVPPMKLVIPCNPDLTKWPFDEVKCKLKFGSWVYDAHTLNLQFPPGKPAADTSNYRASNEEWTLVKVQSVRNVSVYDCCPEPYIDVTYTLHIRRTSYFDRYLVIVPSIVICAITLAVFWLSPTSVSKLYIGSINVFTTTYLLFSFRSLLPSAGNYTPLIVIYHSVILILVGMSVIISIFTRNLTQRRTPVPDKLRQLLTGRLGSILCLQRQNHGPECNTNIALKEEGAQADTRPGGPCGWLLLAQALDRLAFLVYLFTISALLGCCFSR